MRRNTGWIVCGLAALCATTAAAADLETGSGITGRGTAGSSAQRALESRARLETRAAAGASDRSTGAAGRSDRTGGGTANGNASQGAAAGSESRLRLFGGSRPTPQSGSGRLGIEVRTRTSATMPGLELDARAGGGLRTSQGERARQNPTAEQGSPEQAGQSGHMPPYRRDRTAAMQAEILLNNRLATLERMREAAVERGDQQMLDRADQLELIVRRQHESRLSALNAANPQFATDAEQQSAAGVQTAGGTVGAVSAGEPAATGAGAIQQTGATAQSSASTQSSGAVTAGSPAAESPEQNR